MTNGKAPNHDVTTRAPQARPAAARFALVVSAGLAAKVEMLPMRGELVVGRARDCDVCIADESISRRHVRLHVGDEVRIEDLGSRNGTRVGGTWVPKGEVVEVPVGSVVQIGDVTLLLQHASVDLAERAASEAVPLQGPRETLSGAIVADPAMQRLYDLLNVVAASKVAVLILGETGTGKELYAMELHRRSTRSEGPQVSLSCAALPESMLEAELFGYERGAFTGAVQAKPGLLESAHGGTLFLDEVGEIPPTTQAKLLRVLETGETTRLGAIQPRKVDVRIVSATNRDLGRLVAEGRFRADLYFRLNGFIVTLPPLRDRPRDIEALAPALVAQSAAKLQRAVPSLHPDALRALMCHSWPGNVREFVNVIQRAVLLSTDGVVRPEDMDLGETTRRRAAASAAASTDARKNYWNDVESFERQRIVETLEACSGNQTKAAKMLGLHRGTLLAKLDAFGIPRPRKGR